MAILNSMENRNKPIFKPAQKLKLMDQVRQMLRYHHYAYRTEQTYCDWIIRFIKFHDAKILYGCNLRLME
jgi:Phage integrase, N-terminal SAM-like domain